MEGPPRQLVESVAQEVALRCLAAFPAAASARVRVVKPHVALRGVVQSLGVEVHRTRADEASLRRAREPASSL